MLQWVNPLNFLIQEPHKQKLYMFKTDRLAWLVLPKLLKR